MKKLIPTIVLSIIIALLIADNRVKAANAQRQASAENTAYWTAQQIETSLAKVLESTSRNASAKAHARALQREHAKSAPTAAGFQSFRTTLARKKLEIMRPLGEPPRSRVSYNLSELTSSVDRHIDALAAKENAEKTAGGLFAKFGRDWGFSQPE